MDGALTCITGKAIFSSTWRDFVYGFKFDSVRDWLHSVFFLEFTKWKDDAHSLCHSCTLGCKIVGHDRPLAIQGLCSMWHHVTQKHPLSAIPFCFSREKCQLDHRNIRVEVLCVWMTVHAEKEVFCVLLAGVFWPLPRMHVTMSYHGDIWYVAIWWSVWGVPHFICFVIGRLCLWDKCLQSKPTLPQSG